MAAHFAIDQVIVAGCHDFEDGNGLFSPDNLKGFSKWHHKKEKKDWCHIVSLTYADCLRDLDCFFLDLQDAYIVGVNGMDCCDKLWGGTVAFKDA
jgi:hypothetical protein